MSADKSINGRLMECARKRVSMLYWFRMIMERKEPFTMLIRFSSGTEYQDFEHDLATKVH